MDPYLQPAAHALLQASEDFERAARDLTRDQLAARPGGAASVAFHLRHVVGSIDRLLTYARGAVLSDAQKRALADEATAGDSALDAASLVRDAQDAIAKAVDQMRTTPRDTLLEPRSVGRKALPSTVIGLLFHVAEHTQRHAGQCIATAKVVRAVTIDDFQRLDIRVGTVLDAEPFPEARKPAIKMRIDFGASLGVKQSSAQLTMHYTPEQLVGRQVVAVANFPPRRIAGFTSDVLVLGAMPTEREVVLLRVDAPVENGTRIG